MAAATVPALVHGQQNTGYTSVALFKVKPEGTAAFVENMKKFLAPVGAKLLSEGTISGYGLDLDMFHQPGSTNAALWMDVPSFAAFGKAEEAINAAMKASPAVTAGIWGATDISKHSDLMLRHLFVNMKPAPAGALPYSNFWAVKVKPGKMNEYSQLFEKYQKPVYDKMVADGVILGYSVDAEIIHSDAGDMVWIVTVMPDLGAKDKMLAITRALPDRRAMQVNLDGITVEGSHRDSISQSVMFVTK
ncbi:MAG TPA: hypothetical protein VGK29_08745 [Paludibaculum sp.]